MTDPDQLALSIDVSYTPTFELSQFSLDGNDLVVTGPNGFSASPIFDHFDAGVNRTDPTIATYKLVAPGGRFDVGDNGLYTVSIVGNEVFDLSESSDPAIAAGTLGTFTVAVPPPPVPVFKSTGDVLDTNFLVEATTYQPDGKLLLTGSESVSYVDIDPMGVDVPTIKTTRQEVLRRLNADGSIDATFGGGDGTVETGSSGRYSAAYAVFVQPDQKIIIASGQSAGDQYSGAQFVLRRFLADGSVDSNFGRNSGSVSFSFGQVFNPDLGDNVNAEALPYALAFQPDGKIIVAGHTIVQRDDGTQDKDFALCRLNADGSFDDGRDGDSTPGDRFGPGTGDAVAITDLSAGRDDSIGSIKLMPDGSIYVAGVGEGNRATGDGHAAVAKYTPGGLLDTSFNGTGFRVLSSLYTAADDFTVGLDSRSNGDVIVAARAANKSDFALTRIRPNGTTDATFGSGGIATTDFGGTDDADRAISLSNGKILVVGTSKIGNTYTTAVASFNANGSVDRFFGTGGSTGTGDGKQTFDPVTLSGTTSLALSRTRSASLASVILRASLSVNGNGDVVVGRNTRTDESKFRLLKADRAAPTQALSPIASVTTAGGTTLSFVVNYADDSVLNANSIDAADLTITGLGQTFAPTSVSKTGGGQSIAATYTIAALGGTWDPSDNGTYTISLIAGQVTDGANNAVAAGTLGTFTVNVPVPGAGPSAALVPVANVIAGSSTSFTVAYTDDGSVNAASIDPADLVVTGPAGTLTVSAGAGTASGTNAVGTYTVAAPGGSWDPVDNGTYTISLVGGQVLDNGGLAANAGVLGTFNVAATIVSTPPPTEPSGPLEGQLVISAPASAVGGQKAKVKAKIVVTNRTADLFNGTGVIRLVLSTDAFVDASDPTVTILTKNLKLKAGKAKSLSFKIGVLPSVPDGTYQFLASVDGPGGPSDWAAGPNIVMAAPFVDLTTTTASVSSTVKPGKSFKPKLTIANLGNISFKGKPLVSASAVPTAGGSTVDLGVSTVSVSLKPGQSKSYSLKFALPVGFAAGAYTIQFKLDPTAALAESNRENNSASAALTVE